MDSDIYYLGTWTNWSRGPVFGPTVTTTKQYGNLIIAFTAFFVAFVATRFWRILAFILHRRRSNPAPEFTVLRQRQIILRNSSSAESSLISLIGLIWAWRKSGASRLIQLVPDTTLALACIAAFIVAGGFSSSISTAVGDEILIKGDNCAIITTPVNITDHSLVRPIKSQRLNEAATYAQQCYQYNNTLLDPFECSRFVANRLPTATVDTNAKCPFQPEICRTENSNIRLDSGFLNSHDALGINAPKQQRYEMRYVLQCAPLKTATYTSNFTFENRTFVRYHYGTTEIGSADVPITLDFVHQEEDIGTQYSSEPSRPASGKNFKLAAILDDSFTPIPALQVTSGQLTLAFLSGYGVVFSQALDDPWYRANVTWTIATDHNSNGNLSTYRLEEAASPIGCIEQYQWCSLADPSKRRCGPLTDALGAFYGAAPLFNLSSEILDLRRPSSPSPIASSLIWSGLVALETPLNLQGLLLSLGAKSLLSQDRLYGGIQWPLPESQWKLDVNNWFNIMLSLLQSSFVDAASGPMTQDDVPRWQPLNSAEQTICHSQKIRSTAYASFSLFGLYFTFAVGAIVILLSFLLEPVCEYLHRRGGKGQSYADLEWVSNQSLQLHRLAHEKIGRSEWFNCTKEIPTTGSDIALGGLDITDPERPMIDSSPLIYPTKSEPVEKPDHSNNTCDHSSIHRGSLSIDLENSTTEATSSLTSERDLERGRRCGNFPRSSHTE